MLLPALSIGVALALLGGLLFLSAWVERRFLSPRAIVLSTVRARMSSPEYTEQVVARQFEELLTRSR